MAKLKVTNARFYSGPNVIGETSGGLCTVVAAPGVSGILNKPLNPAHIQQILTRARTGLPDMPRLYRVAEKALSQQDTLLPSKVIAILADMITERVAVAHTPTQMISGTSDLRFFIPSDQVDVFSTAAQFAALAADMLLFGAPAAGDEQGNALGNLYIAARQNLRRVWFNQSTLAMIRSAHARDIPYHMLPGTRRYAQLGDGARGIRILETSSDKAGNVTNIFAQDKFVTNQLLAAHGLPTAGSVMVTSLKEAQSAAKRLGYPVVLKPSHGRKGQSVYTNLATEDELSDAFQNLAQTSSGILLERYIVGHDFRLLVVDGKFIAAAQRIPAHVVGDGVSSVERLVEKANQDPRRGMPFEQILEFIKLDHDTHQMLAKAGLSLTDIPQKAQVVQLSGAANISRGGTAIDVTHTIHPDNILMAERATQLSGLFVNGLDFMTPDISKSWRDTPCAILELNATPALRPHIISNPNQDVAGEIVQGLFPDAKSARIPTVGITGSIGKTTTCRMVARILSDAGRTVGLSTTTGAWVGDFQIREDDVAGGRAAKTVLLDPTVDVGVFELARGGLVKRGMSLDALSVGAVLNVGDNHLGLDGVQTREQMAIVKGLVAQSARDTVVLNADDPLCMEMLNITSAKTTCLVSKHSDNAALKQTIASGGYGVFLRSETEETPPEIVLQHGSTVIGTISGADIPASLGGLFLPPIINAAFALGITYSMGLPFKDIKSSLQDFQSTQEDNRGRMNAVPGFPGEAYVTWVDGAVAAAELARFAKRKPTKGRKRLYLTHAGNRHDDFIIAAARPYVGLFDEYVLSDWQNLRNRAPGEVPDIMQTALEDGGVAAEQITKLPSYREAVEHLAQSAQEDDFTLFVTFEDKILWNHIIDVLSDTP